MVHAHRPQDRVGLVEQVLRQVRLLAVPQVAEHDVGDGADPTVLERPLERLCRHSGSASSARPRAPCRASASSASARASSSSVTNGFSTRTWSPASSPVRTAQPWAAMIGQASSASGAWLRASRSRSVKQWPRVDVTFFHRGFQRLGGRVHHARQLKPGQGCERWRCQTRRERIPAPQTATRRVSGTAARAQLIIASRPSRSSVRAVQPRISRRARCPRTARTGPPACGRRAPVRDGPGTQELEHLGQQLPNRRADARCRR